MENIESSRALLKYLFGKFEERGKIEWKNDRFSAFLIRAAYNVSQCDELLRSIPIHHVRASNHKELIDALRDYAFGKESDLERHREYQLWTISCLISDAQHRIAATFDRCVGHWLIESGLAQEVPENKTREKQNDVEDRFYPWIGARLITLKILLRNAMNYCDPSAMTATGHDNFLESGERAVELITNIEGALSLADSSRAKASILFAQDQLHKAIQSGTKAAIHLSACALVDSLAVRKSNSKNPYGKLEGRTGRLQDEECLAIVIGRVNDFKHRATGPVVDGTFSDGSKVYLRHVELAITVQALRSVIRLYKDMTTYLENVPQQERGTITVAQSA